MMPYQVFPNLHLHIPKTYRSSSPFTGLLQALPASNYVPFRHNRTYRASCVAAAPENLPDYETSLWGDYFLNYQPKPLQRSEKWMSVRVDELKEEVRVLFKTCNSTVEMIALVDTVQHLGIDHHFEEQIDVALSDIVESELCSSSLHEVALRFRLLREHGLWVSPDVFNTFKNEDGSFRDDITSDPWGSLSLYNAAHLFIHGEPSLQEAISFARHHLELMRDRLKSPVAEHVKRAFDIPLPRTVKRVETMHYISEYKHEEGHNPTLLELAKLDFNLLQYVHLKELKYHTKWDESATSFLPDYLKRYYIELLRIFKDAAGETFSDTYHVAYARKAFQKISTYHLQEAEWLYQNHKPSFEDFLNLSAMSVGVATLSVVLMVGMGDEITKEAFEWVISCPSIIIAGGKIMRLLDDIAAFKGEKTKWDVASSLESYMVEHRVTSEVAIARIHALIEAEWKTINEARFENRELFPVVKRIIYLINSGSVYYANQKDGFTFGMHLQKTIESLFVNPIPM